MAKYIYVYHGGRTPESDEEMARVLGEWQNWFAQLGERVVDAGGPVGLSATVHGDGNITAEGGANPVSGYSFIDADDDEQAAELARGCPILRENGSVEVAPVMAM